MPAVYQIRFLPGGETQAFCGSRGDHYELPNGTQIDLFSAPVWCLQCNGFTHGESIEPLDEIDRQIRDLRDPTTELFRFYRDIGMNSIGVDGIRFIIMLEKRQGWRVSRKSLPKCLSCGSGEIVPFPDGQEVINPAGPDLIEITVTGLCSTPFMNRFFTPEEDRTLRDTKPTYWHLT